MIRATIWLRDGPPGMNGRRSTRDWSGCRITLVRRMMGADISRDRAYETGNGS